MQKNSALVVFSGGQDSTTCLFWALDQFDSVRAITFDYGQKHAIELEYAHKICEKFKIQQYLIPVQSLSALGGNSLTDNQIVPDKKVKADKLPNTFVPGRNIIFLSLAGAKAYQLGIKNLVTGVGQEDYSGYPDCRDDFIKSLENTMNLGMDYSFMIHRPLMFKNKAQIWKMADDLGYLSDIIELTHTCYNGDHVSKHDWGYGCDDCPACFLRKKGYKEFLEKRNALQTK